MLLDPFVVALQELTRLRLDFSWDDRAIPIGTQPKPDHIGLLPVILVSFQT